MTSEYMHMVVNLVLVLALMLSLTFILKKIKFKKNTGNKSINIVNVVSIGAKEKIILLEVNQTTLLVGATPSSISTLHVFDEGEQVVINETFEKQLADAATLN